MANLDRFGGAEAWDLHCARQDAEYRNEIRGKTCSDCMSFCESPSGDHGWCMVQEDFRHCESSVSSIGCEDFTNA